MAKSITHKKDIKIICPIKNLSAAMTIHGFETYERETDANGRPVKRLIPNVAVQFQPGPDSNEDGFTIAYVSNTKKNLDVIKELMAAGVIACDSPLVEPVEASDKEAASTEASVSSPGEVKALLELNKTDLLARAQAAGLPVTMEMTKKQIVEVLTGTQE